MKLNKLLIIFALIGLLGFMAACGDNDNQNNNNQEAQNNNNQEAQNNNNQEAQNNNNQEDQDNENFNETGFPIVDDKITLDFFAAKGRPEIDWNDDFPVWKEYESMTNIEIDWIEQVDEGFEEKRNLAMASGQLPDVFYGASFTNADLLKYGEQGSFIDLKDLIDKHAPNLKKLMEETPAIEKGITFPDGNIYALPNVKDKDFLSMSLGAKPWIDKKWLDRLDMEVPETTEEFYEFLTAVKENDPDTFPFGSTSMDLIAATLIGSFGLNNTAAQNVDKDPNGDGLRFVPTADEYRTFLEYMHKLYDEELIPQNIYSMEWGQLLADAGEGNYASIVFWNPGNSISGKYAEGEEYEGDMISFFPLEGPYGDQLYTLVNSPLHRNGEFVITNENPYPAETIRWADYFYGDDGSKMMHMGIEGESFVEEDGKYRYSDIVLESAGTGRPVDKFAEYVPGGGENPPAVIKKDYFIGSESMPDSLEAADRIEAYLPDERWPAFTYTEEEIKFVNSTGNDIDKFVVEKRDQFIAGDESLDDENWEKYVETLEGMNLEEYMKIEKDAYERYSSN